MPVGRVELPPHTHMVHFGQPAPGAPMVITGVSGPFADALRAEGALAERERIRLAMLAAADDHPQHDGWGGDALREFARRLEAKP